MTNATEAPPPARETVPDRYFVPQSTRQPVRLSAEQVAKLEEELDPGRIAFDYDGHAHVEGWDVRASLTRIFGFGMWSEVITERRLVQQQFIPSDEDPSRGNWHVSWAVSILLSCWDPHGAILGPFEGTTIETGRMPQLGAAHELARKAAATVALKRAAINLGNQFGLSLYRKPPKNAADKRPRTKAVSGTLQPRAIEQGDASAADPSVVEQTSATAAGTPTPPPETQHEQAPAQAPTARPRGPRTVEDIVKPPPAGDVDQDVVDTARAQLRELALSFGVDPDQFDAAVERACGVPLDQATYEQVARMRAAIESRYQR